MRSLSRRYETACVIIKFHKTWLYKNQVSSTIDIELQLSDDRNISYSRGVPVCLHWVAEVAHHVVDEISTFLGRRCVHAGWCIQRQHTREDGSHLWYMKWPDVDREKAGSISGAIDSHTSVLLQHALSLYHVQLMRPYSADDFLELSGKSSTQVNNVFQSPRHIVGHFTQYSRQNTHGLLTNKRAILFHLLWLSSNDCYLICCCRKCETGEPHCTAK